MSRVVLLLHPISCQPSPLLPVCYWDHLEVGLVPHDMVYKVELSVWSAGGRRGRLSAGLGGTPWHGGLWGKVVGTCPAPHWDIPLAHGGKELGRTLCKVLTALAAGGP